MLVMTPLAFLIGGYLIGSIPWAWLIGRGHGIDIRRHGSGNVGATNVSRVLGKRWGVLCFALDFLKGFLPVLAAHLFLAHAEQASAGEHNLLLIVAVFAPIAGHNWPVFLGFRGGKGVSVSAGALTALTPWAVLAVGLVWLAVFEVSRYVSLASVLAAAALPVAAWTLDRTGVAPCSPPILGLLVGLALLVVLKHHSNLRRLLAGTETKFVRKKDDGHAATPQPSTPESSS
jgi:glycerol-3-phosphate acyltransferase PlsY